MMRTLIAAAGGLLAVATGATAQVVQPLPGYVIIRVNLGAVNDGILAAPGGGDGGIPGGLPGGPGGLPGGPGGLPGGPGGFPPPGGGETPAAMDPSRSVVVVVPYKQIKDRRLYEKYNFHPTRNPVFKGLASEYGQAVLYADKNFIQLYPLKPGFYLPADLRKRFNAWELTHNPQQGLDLVSDALSYGMVDDAFKIAEKLATAVAGWKTPVPEPVTKFVAAYNQIKQKVVDPVPDTPDASRWQSLLGAAAYEQGAHYALVHWGDQSVSKDSTDRRLKLLESNFKAFYLWHALAGQALKVPDKKLVVILADKSTDMPRLRDALDGSAIVSDSFYSSVHNVVVMSPERLDDAGRSFSKFAQTRYQAGWNRDDLLAGKYPELKATETAADVAQVSTLALVDKMVDEEAAVGMVTREATRQLYSSSGLLPQYVVLPEWLDSGIGSLLHKPKGPIYNTQQNRTVMTVGIAAGYGSPNYVLVRQFRELITTRELNPKAEELLTNTLMDKYFDAVRDNRDIDPRPAAPTDGAIGFGTDPGAGPQPPGGQGPVGPGPVGPGGRGGAGGPGGLQPPPGGEGGFPPPGGGAPGFGQPNQGDPAAEARKLKAKLVTKSQVTAWALTFYMAKKKMSAMLDFFADLNRMPRDMRLDRNVVLMTFCNRFQLMDAINPEKIDQAAFKRFAQDWVDFMKAYAAWGIDIPLDQTNADPNQGQGIGNFGQPGGAPPGGPPGGRQGGS